MGLIQRVSDVLSWSTPSVGSPLIGVSLTSDDGTWVKLSDHIGERNVVFLTVGTLNTPATDAWLSAWNEQLPQLLQTETIVFGINTARTEQLRAIRTRLGLGFALLYDPLAITARAMRCSSRLRPSCKDNVVAVNKAGLVLFSARGMADPQVVLAAIADGAGMSLDDLAPSQAKVQTIDSTEAERLLNTEKGGYILIDVRTTSEYEADHSPVAVHLPIDELPARFSTLGQDKRILCVCQAGDRSAAAAEFLTSIGCTEVFDVEGGMSAWDGERVTGGQRQA